ncbi:Histidine kinase CKI1 [Acorus gramineus]|uniref:Histidine kinase CKI1 n=1 Tax=Acorus gramineus TaxID=55184 RepID=A0AAV9B388_ACOGR|nr:Histidine kinase CKI1 [Acorus gramineus]KAK1271625.1 Histidine kinase CKI1 [Acorus gramineus]
MGSSISKKIKEASSSGSITHNVEGNLPLLKGSPGQDSGNFTSKNKLLALVVDDNRVNRRILGMFLSKLGVDSQEAENGQQAVDIFLGGASFDIVFMDREMPVMDGLKATKMLRSIGVKTKIIGVSANNEKEEIAEFMASGINEFHTKPLDSVKLATIIRGSNGSSF